jgi:uncharacterized protein YodC (DUF2158 family)
MSFQIGEKVSLKTGCAVMIIDKIDGEFAECVWQDKDHRPYREKYHRNNLQKVEGPSMSRRSF